MHENFDRFKHDVLIIIIVRFKHDVLIIIIVRFLLLLSCDNNINASNNVCKIN